MTRGSLKPADQFHKVEGQPSSTEADEGTKLEVQAREEEERHEAEVVEAEAYWNNIRNELLQVDRLFCSKFEIGWVNKIDNNKNITKTTTISLMYYDMHCEALLSAMLSILFAQPISNDITLPRALFWCKKNWLP